VHRRTRQSSKLGSTLPAACSAPLPPQPQQAFSPRRRGRGGVTRHRRPPPRGAVDESSIVPPPTPASNLLHPLRDRPPRGSAFHCRASTGGDVGEVATEPDPRRTVEEEARSWRMARKPVLAVWMRMETSAAHPAFGSLRRMLHFCIATEGE
jgi:hypothetical protein